MSVDIRRKPRFDEIASRVEGKIRLRDGQALHTFAVRTIRNGRGGIADQFARQGELPLKGGFKRWKRSQRAQRERGFTLIDSRRYYDAWTGGAGSVAEVRGKQSTRLRVSVGVDRSRFPQVDVFQADAPTRTGRGAVVAPRPVSVSKQVAEDLASEITGRALDGVAA